MTFTREMVVLCNSVSTCMKVHYNIVGLVVSVSAPHTVGREFASWPGHTNDHHKNGTDCLPAWHAMR